MNGSLEFLIKHGYLVLFVVVLAEQIGLPVPSAPVLLATGALVGLGHFHLLHALTLAVIASLIGDVLWFYLGRLRGSSVLRFLCKISLEPDTCVRTTESAYTKYGAASLLFAKFVPGLSTVAPPMAGLFRLAPWKFVLLDGGGAALWAGAFVGVGWIFRLQLENVAHYLERMGVWFGMTAIVGLAAYIGFKYIQRQRIYHALRIARILPDDLKNRLDAGEKITIIDVRNVVERSEGAIPGALPVQISQLDSLDRAHLDNEIVLYCSCPNEVTAARAALHLKRLGAMRVRPLQGGFELWRDMGFPVEMPVPAENTKATALASKA